MNIVDVVKFNDGIAVVVDKIGELTYENIGGYLVGSDESGIFFDCLYFDMPTKMFKAFAGREFDLKMKDGSVTHCNGQYWSGKVKECSERLGITLCDLSVNTFDNLKQCYVFCGYQVNRDAYYMALKEFFTENPNYEVYGYWEYEEKIRHLNKNRNDHPSKEWQEALRSQIMNHKQ